MRGVIAKNGRSVFIYSLLEPCKICAFWLVDKWFDLTYPFRFYNIGLQFRTTKCLLSVFCYQKFISIQAVSYTIIYRCFHALTNPNINQLVKEIWIAKYNPNCLSNTWWRRHMEAFSALLAIFVGNSPVSGEFPARKPVTRSFNPQRAGTELSRFN